MMQDPLVSPDERQRQTHALLGMRFFAEGPNPDLDRVARIACHLFQCDAAFLGFPHGARLIIKGQDGIHIRAPIPRKSLSIPVQAEVWNESEGMTDIGKLVTTIAPGAASCGCVPVTARSTVPVGFLCVVSYDGRSFSESEREQLREYGELVSSGIAAHTSELVARRAEHAQAESERRLRALLESFPDLIFRISKDGVYREVHAADSGILADAQLVGRRLHDVLERELADQLIEAIHSSLERQELTCIDYKLQTLEKGERHFEARAMPCADDEVVFTVRDITDRQHTALRLAAKESLLEAVMRATILLLTRPSLSVAVRDAFALIGRAVDVDRVYYFENHTRADGELLCSQRFEWTRDNVAPQLGNPDLQSMVYDEVFPDWRRDMSRGRPIAMLVSEVEGQLRLSMEAQAIRSFLLVPILQNGDFIGFVGFDDCRQDRNWSETELSALMTAAACLGGAIVQRKSRFELGNSRARYKTIVDNVNDIIFQTDDSGTLHFLNPSWENAVGSPASEAIGRRLHDFVAREDATVIDRCIDALRNQQVSECRHDIRLACADGTTRWVQLYARASHDEHGAIAGLFGTLHDVSERRLYEDALVAAKDRAEEMAMLKSSFLANMSHEIRTPLTSILGFSQILMEEVDGEQREMIDLIVRNGNRLMETLNSVLELARLESEDIRLNIQPVRIDREIQEMVRLLSHRTAREGPALRYEIDGPVMCQTDATILRRILDNLVGNALKFTPKGEVVIAATSDSNGVSVAVRDTGIGIDAAFLANLFEDFTQESSGLDRQFEGAGLGLSITRRMVSLIGGTISVESAKGVGSTFTVILPRYPVPIPEEDAVISNNGTAATSRVPL